jgi:hypothetical protein
LGFPASAELFAPSGEMIEADDAREAMMTCDEVKEE